MALCSFFRRNQQKLGADDDYNMDEMRAESEADKQAAHLQGMTKAEMVINSGGGWAEKFYCYVSDLWPFTFSVTV